MPTIGEVPRSAWVLAWSCLVSQLASLAERGFTDPTSALISAPLSALVVWWISSGVLRARMGRVWFAGILMALLTLLGVVALFVEPSPWLLVLVVIQAVALVALVDYTRSEFFAQLRTQPKGGFPALGSLLAIAVVVGVLGGLTTPPGNDGDQSGFHIRIGL
jgi:hypothetical protein